MPFQGGDVSAPGRLLFAGLSNAGQSLGAGLEKRFDANKRLKANAKVAEGLFKANPEELEPFGLELDEFLNLSSEDKVAMGKSLFQGQALQLGQAQIEQAQSRTAGNLFDQGQQLFDAQQAQAEEQKQRLFVQDVGNLLQAKPVEDLSQADLFSLINKHDLSPDSPAVELAEGLFPKPETPSELDKARAETEKQRVELQAQRLKLDKALFDFKRKQVESGEGDKPAAAVFAEWLMETRKTDRELADLALELYSKPSEMDLLKAKMARIQLGGSSPDASLRATHRYNPQSGRIERID